MHSDPIDVAAYTYTAIRSLPLQTPTQRYDHCHCMHLHSDPIDVAAYSLDSNKSSEARNLCIFPPSIPFGFLEACHLFFANVTLPAQRYDRCTPKHNLNTHASYLKSEHLSLKLEALHRIPNKQRYDRCPRTHTAMQSLSGSDSIAA